MSSRARQHPGVRRQRPPLVGRSAERALLYEQIAATETSHGGMVLIGGEAGVGKSALVRVLAANAAEQGFRILIGHAWDLTSSTPYGPWLDLVSRYAPADDADPRPPEILRHHDLRGFTTQTDLLDRLAAFLAELTAGRPTLLILEDVHWADSASLELLRRVATSPVRRLLIVATYRVDEQARRHPFYRHLAALVRETDGLRLDLGPLSRHDLEELVATGYGLPDADRDRLTSYLERYGEGSPLLTLELLRSLEGNELRETPAGWRLGPLDRLVMPDLLRHLTEERVSRLREEDRGPLGAAAVIGEDVALDVWSRVTGLTPDRLCDLVERAADANLLAPSTDGLSVRFTHALTRAALIQGLLAPRRRILHRAIADALIADRESDVDAVAWHLEQAGDPRAPEWLIRAAEHAQRTYAWVAASDRFATAASMLEDRPETAPLRARLLYRSGRLLRYADPATAVSRLERARRIAETIGDAALAADARYSLGMVQCFADDWREGIANVQAGIASLGELADANPVSRDDIARWLPDALPEVTVAPAGTAHDDSPGVASARRGSLPWFQAAIGRAAEALSMSEALRRDIDGVPATPLAIADLGHADVGRGIALSALERPDEARAAFASARALYSRVDHHMVIGWSYLTELLDVVIPWHADDPGLRRDLARRAERALDRAGEAFPTPLAARIAWMVPMYLDGNWTQVLATAEDAPPHLPCLLRRQLTHTLAPIARAQGRPDDAWRHIMSILPDGPSAAPGTAIWLDALMLQRLAADLAIDAGDTATAQRWMDAAEHWHAWGGGTHGAAELTIVRARLALTLGDDALAETRIDHAVRLATASSQPLALLRAQRLAGTIAAYRGERAKALSALSASLALCDSCAMPWERAQTLIAITEAHRTDDSGRAASLLAEARSICERLGVRLALDGVDSPPPSPNVSARQLGLTPRELDVVRLVPYGLSNAEIGTRLHMSPRTVGHHLSTIFGKLDIHTRAELTAIARDHGIS